MRPMLLVVLIGVIATTLAYGELVTFDPPALNHKGRLMVPCEPFAKQFQVEFSHSEEDGSVTLSRETWRETKSVVLRVGAREATVDDKKVALPCPVEARGDAIYAPLRPVVEALGGDVEWYAESEAALVQLGDRRAFVRTIPVLKSGQVIDWANEDHPGPVASVAVDAAGARVAVFYHRAWLEVWDVAANRRLWRKGFWEEVEEVGEEVEVPAPDEAEEDVFWRKTAAQHSDLAFAKDGRTLAVSNWGTLQIRDASTGKKRWEKDFGQERDTIAIIGLAPDATACAVAVQTQDKLSWKKALPPDAFLTQTRRLAVYELPTGKRVWQSRKKIVGLEAIALSNGGRRLAGLFESGKITTWDIPSGKTSELTGEPPESSPRLLMSPDAQFLVYGNQGIHALRREDGKQAPLYHYGGEPQAISPTGNFLVAAIPVNHTCIMELGTEKLVAKTEPHLAAVNSAAVSADGRVVVTGSADGTVWAFDTTNRDVLLSANHSDLALDIGLREDMAIELEIEFPRAPISFDEDPLAAGYGRIWEHVNPEGIFEATVREMSIDAAGGCVTARVRVRAHAWEAGPMQLKVSRLKYSFNDRSWFPDECLTKFIRVQLIVEKAEGQAEEEGGL